MAGTSGRMEGEKQEEAKCVCPSLFGPVPRSVVASPPWFHFPWAVSLSVVSVADQCLGLAPELWQCHLYALTFQPRDGSRFLLLLISRLLHISLFLPFWYFCNLYRATEPLLLKYFMWFFFFFFGVCNSALVDQGQLSPSSLLFLPFSFHLHCAAGCEDPSEHLEKWAGVVETVLLLPYCVYIVYFGVYVGEEEHHEMPSCYHFCHGGTWKVFPLPTFLL